MRTRELIKKAKEGHWVGDASDVKDEVIQKLRQLKDIKNMLREMWELSSQRDEIQWDLTQILEE